MKDNSNCKKGRIRAKSLGIKLTEKEKNEFTELCNKLKVTQLEFLLNAMKEYKEA